MQTTVNRLWLSIFLGDEGNHFMATNWAGFRGTAKQMDDKDIGRIAHMIGVGEDPIRAFMDVEASGEGFDSKGRPKMLRETHRFWDNLGPGPKRDRAAKLGLATPKWVKNYPADSYPDLGKMMGIDETAALESCSWGFEQCMGENYKLAGFPTVQMFVKAHMADEENHLLAMVHFIKASGIDDDLRRLDKMKRVSPDDCRSVVRVYNGKGYEKNNYHTKFANRLNYWKGRADTNWDANAVEIDMDAVVVEDTPARATGDTDVTEKLAAAETVDLYDGKVHPQIESVQKKLDEIGYPEVGAVDGKWGNKTRAVILAFRADKGLPLVPTIDDQLMAALMVAGPRYVSPVRANATVADLRAEGAEDVHAADVSQIGGGVAAGGGALALVGNTLDAGENYSGIFQRAAALLDPIKGFIQSNAMIILVVVGGIVVYQAYRMKQIRLAKHQTGQDVSR